MQTRNESSNGPPLEFKDAIIVAPGDAIIVVDTKLQLQLLNGAVFARHGYQRDEIVGRSIGEVLPAPAWERLRPYWERALDGETFTVDWDSDDGAAIYELTFGPVLRGQDIVGAAASARDVTEPRRLARELDSTRGMLEAVFDYAPIGKYVTRLDADGIPIIRRCNPAFAKMLGLPHSEIIGRTSADFLHPDDLEIRSIAVTQAVQHGTATFEARWLSADGTEIWTQNSVAVATDPAGNELYIIQCADLTDHRRLEKDLRYVVDHDPLTGLLTRRSFGAELVRELHRTKEPCAEGALLLIDVDDFKQVNASKGQVQGDQLLSDLARRFTAVLRDHDIVARMDGDQFAVLIPASDDARLAAVAARLLRAAVETNVITVSIGITLFTSAPEYRPGQLLTRAETAVAAAKAAGGNRVHGLPT